MADTQPVNKQPAKKQQVKKAPEKLDYTVLKDYKDNGPHKKGETVSLTKRQATFLLSGGFIAPVAGTKAKKTATSES